MRHLDQWCKDKDELVSFIVRFMFSRLGGIAEFIRFVEAGTWGYLFGCDLDIEEWSRFYRDKEYLHLKLAECVVGPTQAVELLNDDGTEMIKPQSGSLLSDIISLVPSNKAEDIPSQLIHFMSDLNNNKLDDEAIKSIELPLAYLFVMQVYFPCIVYYKQLPFSLYSEAVAGDVESLDQLLRLDKSIIADCNIGQKWHEAMLAGYYPQRKKLIDAVAGTISAPDSLKHIKVHFGAMLQLVGKSVGCEISPSEIRNLFDAVERDKKNVNHRDVDLPAEDGALQKALSRARKQLREFPAFSSL